MPKIRDFNRVTALYERLSKDDEQQGESNSILNQKRFLEDFARKSGRTSSILPMTVTQGVTLTVQDFRQCLQKPKLEKSARLSSRI